MADVDVKMMKIRMPGDAKAWLEREAARNLSSQNSELVRLVRDAMTVSEQAEQEVRR